MQPDGEMMKGQSPGSAGVLPAFLSREYGDTPRNKLKHSKAKDELNG
jgi:hypothetical protein